MHELVRLHGGEVRVESEVGRGATFFVAIPTGTAHLPQDRLVQGSSIAADGLGASVAQLLEAKQWMRTAEPLAVTPQSAAQTQLLAPATPRARLIVADDNADMREYLKRLLSPHWDTEVVPNGRAALAAALAAPPDLVLSDVMMPELDGVSCSLRCVPIRAPRRFRSF